MESKASAVWKGSLKEGQGHFSTKSGVLKDVPYSFATRFEGAEGTNPEELVGAAHAGCFSMALSMILGESGLTPDKIATSAAVTMERVDGKMTVSKVHLVVSASVPGASDEAFQEAAEKAKAGCPISRLLKAEVSMDATLES
jgi:osmotically inducible protein OsmC